MTSAKSRCPAAASLRLTVAAVLGAMAGSLSRVPPPGGVPTVAAAKTARTRLASAMTLQGELHPFQGILIYAKVSGYVRAIRVDIGDRVRAGELMATLEVPELSDLLASAVAAGQMSLLAEDKRIGLTSKADQPVEVTDTGTGIPPEALPLVFERFHRVDQSRSRQPEGAGLGLAIIKSICKAHGGEIDAESAPGRGSTFRVRLPLAA